MQTIKTKQTKQFDGLLKDEEGLTTVEYIIILCLIAVVGFAIWKKFGETVQSRVSNANSVINDLPSTS